MDFILDSRTGVIYDCLMISKKEIDTKLTNYKDSETYELSPGLFVRLPEFELSADGDWHISDFVCDEEGAGIWWNGATTCFVYESLCEALNAEDQGNTELARERRDRAVKAAQWGL